MCARFEVMDRKQVEVLTVMVEFRVDDGEGFYQKLEEVEIPGRFSEYRVAAITPAVAVESGIGRASVRLERYLP
jgi:hypothetical protein